MRTSKSAPALGQIGHLIPRLLLAVGLLDLGLRFIPVEPLTFRAWEALTRYRPPGAAFEPNRHYENDRAYGDIAAMGNLPEVRQYRREVFSTDAFGFRNAVHVALVVLRIEAPRAPRVTTRGGLWLKREILVSDDPPGS